MRVFKLVPDDDEEKEVKKEADEETDEDIENEQNEEDKDEEPGEEKEEFEENEGRSWDDDEEKEDDDVKTWDDDENEDFINVGNFEMKKPKVKEDDDEDVVGDIRDLVETIIIILLVLIAWNHDIEAREEVVYKFIKKRERRLKRICEKVDRVLKRTEYYKKLVKMNDYTFIMDIFLLTMTFEDELDEMQMKKLRKDKTDRTDNIEIEEEYISEPEPQREYAMVGSNDRLKLLINY